MAPRSPLTDRQVLGRAIRVLRERANVTQKELAARADSAEMHISRVERGQIDVGWSTLLRLLRAVGTDLRGLADAIDTVNAQAPNAQRRGQPRRNV
jgi:transcriptional regulator with XRE-family HTH domain